MNRLFSEFVRKFGGAFLEVCETMSGGSGEVFRGKMNENCTEKIRKNKQIPIRYYQILFKIALNSLFNEWGVSAPELMFLKKGCVISRSFVRFSNTKFWILKGGYRVSPPSPVVK